MPLPRNQSTVRCAVSPKEWAWVQIKVELFVQVRIQSSIGGPIYGLRPVKNRAFGVAVQVSILSPLPPTCNRSYRLTSHPIISRLQLVFLCPVVHLEDVALFHR
jgi:hypothetical protein